MPKGDAHKNFTKCWTCRHAVPKKIFDLWICEEKYVRGCPWSIDRKPVRGWVAEKSEFINTKGKTVPTYFIKSCPMYERGRK